MSFVLFPCMVRETSCSLPQPSRCLRLKIILLPSSGVTSREIRNFIFVCPSGLKIGTVWRQHNYRYIFLRRHSAFLSQYACIVQQRWRFWASLYFQSKSDAWRNLNFRYKGKLELSVLLPWLPWLVKRDELRLASGIFLIYLYCASKAERKLRKKL